MRSDNAKHAGNVSIHHFCWDYIAFGLCVLACCSIIYCSCHIRIHTDKDSKNNKNNQIHAKKAYC